ncbi:MAG: hypothetical protein ACOYOU_05010 [Kiritimatiellia bacterium]
MRLFPPTSRCVCIVCERPARLNALVCDYCGEDLPQHRSRLLRRMAAAAAAVCCTVAFAVVRGGVWAPANLTLPAAMLVALGVGLALLPPRLRGVARTTRMERLRQVSWRYFSSLALAVLTAWATLVAGSPNPWSRLHAILAAAAFLALLVAPRALQIPWHKLAAGGLLAAGLLLSH